jgi:signal transduction histidine kinase/ActR/RegA family two-component response regulator
MIEDSRKNIRLGLIFGFALYSLFAILDFYMLPINYVLAWKIRFLVIAPSLGLVYILTYYKVFQKYSQYILFILLTSGQLGIVAMILISSPDEPAYFAYYAGLILVILWANFIFRLSFQLAIYIGFSTIFLYILTALMQQNNTGAGMDVLQATHYLGNNFFLISAAVLTSIGAYQLNNQKMQTEAYQRELLREKELLSEAKERAEESNRLKTAFINNISHEIRTPLNGIVGFAELLLNPRLGQKEKEDYYAKVLQGSNRLVQTITDYIDISMLAAGSMSIEKKSFLLSGFLGRLSEKYQKQCKSKGLVFSLQISDSVDGAWIMADEGLLEKAVGHLLSNAVKFTRKGRVNLSCALHGDEIYIMVIDTGSGLSNSEMATIFDAFQQADHSTTRGYEGSGLGLAIVKGICKLMDTTIEVKSEKGKGSRFTLRLPAPGLNNKPHITYPSTTRVPFGQGSLVLVAEDDESGYLFVKMVLKKSGFRCMHALNGTEAVEMCRLYPDIALVIMDIKMPEMDGMKATNKIKLFRPELPVIALTAYARTGDAQNIISAGCDAYLSKPINASALLEKIHTFTIRTDNSLSESDHCL